MDKNNVKDLMVPLSEYATVSEDATLHDAVIALEKIQKKYNKNHYPHRAVLVTDSKGHIIGKISQLDIIRALEPKYEQIGESNPLSQIGLSRFGFSQGFLKSLQNQFELWDQPLDDICSKAAKLKAKNFMYKPTEGEYVKESASLNEAIHQLVMGHHHALLVTSDDKIVGILRLTDVFMKVCRQIKTEAAKDNV